MTKSTAYLKKFKTYFLDCDDKEFFRIEYAVCAEQARWLAEEHDSHEFGPYTTRVFVRSVEIV